MNEEAVVTNPTTEAEPLSAFDIDLDGLDLALDPARLQPVLDEALGGESPVRILGIHLLKHRPRRRCSLAVDVEANGRRRRLFVKVFRHARAGRVERAMRHLRRALSRTETTRVPRPLHAKRSPNILITEFVEGAAVAPYLYSMRPAETAGKVARSLADLHASGVELPRVWRVEDELANTRRWVAQVPDDLRDSARRLLSELQTLAPPDVRPMPIHRDFYPEQLLTSGRHCYLLDLDDARMGDGAVDAGNFLAHLRLRSFEDRGRRGACVRAANAFRRMYLEARSRDMDLSRRVDFYEVATLLRLAGFYSSRGEQNPQLPMVLLNVARARLDRLSRR